MQYKSYSVCLGVLMSLLLGACFESAEAPKSQEEWKEEKIAEGKLSSSVISSSSSLSSSALSSGAISSVQMSSSSLSSSTSSSSVSQYKISGQVKLDGASLGEVWIFWSATDSLKTDTQGQFNFSVPLNYKGLIFPSKVGYEFQHALDLSSGITADQSNILFEAGRIKLVVTVSSVGKKGIPSAYKTVYYGDSLQLSADSQGFRYWRLDGDSVSPLNTYTLKNIKDNHDLVAVY